MTNVLSYMSLAKAEKTLSQVLPQVRKSSEHLCSSAGTSQPTVHEYSYAIPLGGLRKFIELNCTKMWDKSKHVIVKNMCFVNGGCLFYLYLEVMAP